MFSDAGYSEVSGSDSLEYISGYAFDNMTILNAVTPGGSDAFQYNVDDMDQCLQYSNPDNILAYYSISNCMKHSDQYWSEDYVPKMCYDHNDDTCTDDTL